MLLHALELALDGSFRFRTLLVLCARQQGKTTLMQALALWRLYVDRAGLVSGAAQNLTMAEETWEGARSMVEGVPDLAAEVAHVSPARFTAATVRPPSTCRTCTARPQTGSPIRSARRGFIR